MYAGWNMEPDPNLKGIIRGYKVRAWLTVGENITNITQARMFDGNEITKNLHIHSLNVNLNYTFIVYAFTGSGVLGPGSVPVTNREEIGMSMYFLYDNNYLTNERNHKITL